MAGLLADPLLAEHQATILPSRWLEQVIPLRETVSWAGRLAAGVEKNGTKGDLSQSLQSVFSNITTPEGKIPAPVYWSRSALALDEQVVMPSGAKTTASKPWSDFLAEAAALKSMYEGASDESMPAFIENLSLLMQRTLWCLPSSYFAALPDVSLYDHSRMTAALAAALADWKNGQPIAQLVGGDLSGVQKFIYTISASGATSALRGRSFYLQLLTDATARYLLGKLELPITSLVYAGGGNFYLLAPAGADLTALRGHISRVLLHHHSGDLYLAIGALDLREQDFFKGEIARRWQELTDTLNRAKSQPFMELGEGLKQLFVPQGHGGNEDLQCQVCGLEHPQTVIVKDRRICPQCASYEDLGRDLRKARYLSYAWMKERDLPIGKPVPEKWSDVLAHFGMRAIPSVSIPNLNGSAGVVYALADDATQGLKPAVNQVAGRRFMVNVTPEISQSDLEELHAANFEPMPNIGDIKPYDVLERQSQGIRRLGVMRMDVDNLSTIISRGFDKKGSLSRIGALSFAISLFFEGWVGYIAEKQNREDKNGERLYSIYSGGDDLFFVGSWDAVIELTRQIRADLGRYAGGHPGIHASAGMALVGGKYPLYQAAQDAGEAEDDAKEHQWFDDAGKSHSKDAITFLGQTMPWAQFGVQACSDLNPHTVHALAHKLETSMQDGKSSRALLGLLINLQSQYDEKAREWRQKGADLTQERKPQILWGPWNWLSVYYLKRMKKRSSESFNHVLDDILHLFENQFASIQWVGLAARWAELKLRK
jgi:CRISPR-associated protein Csm1